jgi:cobalt/nickel transport system permease protein
MHLPDGLLSHSITLATCAGSFGVCAAAVIKASRDLDERQVPLLGMTGAFIFAAQMLNFPIAVGTTGHFMGAALAAILLGPLNACFVLALVLGIQCLLFGDGGLTALGANTFNMGVVGAFTAYGVFYVLRLLLPATRWGTLAASAVAAWLSIVAAAGMCALELAWSGANPLWAVMPAMVGIHAVIGVGEAAITTATLSAVLLTRPDLMPSRFRLAPINQEV